MTDRGLLTTEEAQKHLGVSRATFWNLVKRYDVPRYTVPLSGKRVYFKLEDLDHLRDPRPAKRAQEIVNGE
jgi:predicted DNA-binding transcriptional regulator AlpA